MVSSSERLWSDEDIIGMDRTVLQLRKMRSAITGDLPSAIFRFRQMVKRALFQTDTRTETSEEILLKAENLADAAGDFFAAHLSNITDGSHELELWQHKVSEAEALYGMYKISTYARSSMSDVVGNSIIGRLRNIHIDPEHMLHWDLVKNNNLGSTSVHDLIQKSDIGILAPLSGDYLMASTYSAYLRRTEGKTFPTKAVALNRNLTKIVLPEAFQEKSEIGLYIDTTETGNTSRVLFENIQNAYPGEKVHKPNMERVEFSQSKKMRKYWKK